MKKKLLSLCLATVSMVVIGMNAFAADQSITDAGVASVDINANIVSTFEVITPTNIDITERGIKDFKLTASGTISPKEYLKIEVPDSVTMNTEGKDPMDLVVTIDNDELDNTELANTTEVSCFIDASEITSGEWTGLIEIVITLIDTTVTTP